MFKEFVDFLKTYGIIGLAIAVIIGGKLNELVGSFVNDLLMPIIFSPALKAAKVENIRLLNHNGILYGKFLGSLLDFVIVGFVIFIIARKLPKPEPKVVVLEKKDP